MSGPAILRDAIARLVQNFDAAVRLSLLLWLAQAVARVLFIAAWGAPLIEAAEEGGAAPAPQLPPGFWLGWGVTTGLAVLASLWIAVGWHRFALLGELPAGLVPIWHGQRLAAYLGTTLAIAALFFVAAATLGLLLTGLAAAAGGAMALLPALLLPFGIWAFYRLSPALPAVAAGRAMRLREAWALTAPANGAVIQLAVLLVLAGLAVQIGAGLVLAPLGAAGEALMMVVGWGVLMVSVSVMTELYARVAP